MSNRSISISGGKFGGPVVFGDVAGSVLGAGSPAEEAARGEQAAGQAHICLHLGIDLVSYRSRRGPQQPIVQERLARLIDGLRVDVCTEGEVRMQSAGDGANLIFPGNFDLRPGIRRILTYLAQGVADDGARYGDPMVVRVAFEVGPTAPTALGQDGLSIIALSEMLDCEALREVAHDDGVRVAFGLSRTVHRYVVQEGYLAEWERHIRLEEFTHKDGWRDEVWVGVVQQA